MKKEQALQPLHACKAGERYRKRRAFHALLIASLATSALSPALGQSVPVVTPPLQPANSRTSLDITPAGTPIVNIAAPDTNGTSHNVYTTLSVAKEGLIFNNSPTTGQSTVGGYLLANPNLAGGPSANLILNEVTGGVRTTLAGPAEVFGKQAALVIANPTGITCDGCGFLNTSRVSLAAANLQFGADGSFTGFRTSGGDITVEGQGLLAGNVDYFDIIAAATHLNASLYARDLVVASGSGSFDYASRTASGADGAGVVIDSSALGGMYANRIRLVATGAGVGINLAGTVAALDGPLEITADGAIQLAKAVSAGDATIVSAGNAITLTDQAYAGGSLVLSGVSIAQGGGFAGALGDVFFASASDITLGGNGVYAGLDGNGDLTGAGKLALKAGGAVDAANATLAAGGSLAIDAASLTQGSVGQIAGAGITLTTTGAQSLGGAISSSADARIVAGAMDLTGSVGANGALILSGQQITLAGAATGLASASGTATESLTLTGAGVVQSNGTTTLTAPRLNFAGNVASGGGIALSGDNIVNSGNILSGGDLSVAATGDATLGGTLGANGDANLAIAGKTDLTGVLSANGDLALTAGDVSTSAASQVLSGKSLAITMSGAFTNAGALMASGDMALGGGTSLSQDGTIQAGGNLTLQAPLITLSGQTVGAANGSGQVSLDASTITFTAASELESGDSLTLGSTSDLTTQGRIVALGGASITSRGALTQSAALLSDDAVALRADTTLTQVGTLEAAGPVSLYAAIIINDGSVASNETLDIDASRAISSNGSLLAGSGLTLKAPSVALSGTAATNDVLRLTAATVMLSGTASGLKGVSAIANDLTLTSASTLQSGDALGLDLVSLDNAGLIASGTTLNLSTSGRFGNSGQVVADTSLDLAARSGLVSTGLLQSGANLTAVVAGAAALGGTVYSDQDISLDVDSLTLTGTLAAKRKLDIASGGGVSLTDGSETYAASALVLSAVDLNAAGTIQSDGALDIVVSRTLGLAGATQASGASTLTAGATATVSGTLASGEALTLVAPTVSIPGQILANGAVTVTANTDNLGLAGTIQAAKDVALTAVQRLTIGTAGGSGATDGGDPGGSSGSESGPGGSSGGSGGLDGGSSSFTLDVPQLATPIPGSLVSDGAVTLSAADIDIYGLVATKEDLAALATHVLTVEGSAWADGKLTAEVGSLLVGNGASLAAQGPLKVAALSDIANLGTIASNGGDVTLGYGGSIANGGTISARNAYSVTTAADYAAGGTVSAGMIAIAARDISLAGAVTGVEGLVLSGRNVSLGATSDIESGGILAIRSAGALGLYGKLVGAGDMTLDAGSTLALGSSANVQAGGRFQAQAVTDLSAADGSMIAAIGAASFRGTNLLLDGEFAGSAALGLDASSMLSIGGELTALGDITARGANAAKLTGTLASEGNLTLTGGVMVLDSSSSLQAGDTLVLDATSLASVGTLEGLKGITVASSGDVSLGGTLLAGSLDNNGAVTSLADLSLTAAGLFNFSAAASATGDVWLKADQVNAGGSVVSLGDLRLDAVVLSATGTLQANDALIASATGDMTLGGSLSGLASLTAISGGGLAQNAVLGTNDKLSLTAAGNLVQTGTATALGDISFSGATVTLDGTTLAKNITLTSAGDADVAGTLAAISNLTTAVAGSLNVTPTGVLEAGTSDASGNFITTGAMVLSAGVAITNAGYLGSTGSLQFDTASLANSGTISTGADIELTAASLSLGGNFISQGDVSVTTTAGALDVSGTVEGRNVTLSASGGNLMLATGSQITAYGIGTDGRAILSSADALNALGTITANDDIALTAGLDIHIGADRVGTSPAYALSTAGSVALSSGGALVNDGTIQVGRVLTLTATSLASNNLLVGDSLDFTASGNISLTGTTWAKDGVALSSIGGRMTLASTATVQSQGAITLKSAGDLVNAGAISAGTAGSGNPAGTVTLASDGALSSSGAIVSNNDAVNLSGTSITLGGALSNGGGVYAATSVSLNAPQFTVVDGGDVIANDALIYTGRSLTLGNASLLQSNGDVAITLGSPAAAGSYTSAGNLVALGDLALGVTGTLVGQAGSGIFAGGSGGVAPGGSITLAATRIENAGLVVATASGGGTGGNVTVNSGTITNSGLVHADKTLALATNSLVVDGRFANAGNGLGTIESGNALTIAIPSVDLVNGGTLRSAGDLTLSAANLHAAGSILSGGNLDVAASTSFAASGMFGASGAIKLSSGTGMTLDGAASASGSNLSVSAAGTLALGSRAGLYGNTGITVSADTIGIAASADAAINTLASHGDIALVSTHGLSLGGSVVADGSVSLTDATSLTLASGSLVSAGSRQASPSTSTSGITLRAPSLSSMGTLTATGILGLVANSASFGGNALANGDITFAGYTSGAAPTLSVTSGGQLATYLGNAHLGTLSGLTLAGTLQASNGDVSFSAPGAVITSTGRLAVGRNASLVTTGGGNLRVDGNLLANGDVTLTGGTLAVGAMGTVQAGNNLAFTTGDARDGAGVVSVNGAGYNFAATPISATIAGKLAAGHDLRLSMRGALIADGSAQIIASNDLAIIASHAVIGARYTTDGSGNPLTLGVIAGHDFTFGNSDTIAPGGMGSRGLVLDGSIQAGHDLVINASGEVISSAASQLVAGNGLTISGSALRLAGYNSGQTSVGLTATGNTPQGVVTTVLPGDITLAGATASNGRVSLSANTATITATGSITTYGGSGNVAAVGRNIGAAANIDLETAGMLTNNGAIWSDGVVFLKSANGNLVNNATGANGGITGSAIVTQTDSGSFLNLAGAFKAANAGLFLTGDFTNTATFAPSGNYWISAGNISNTGLLATSGSLRLDASGNLTNAGTIFSGNDLTINVGGTLANTYVGDDQGNGSHGLILAQNDINITARDVLNESATIQSLAGDIGVTLTGGNFTNTIKTLTIAEIPGTAPPGGLYFQGKYSGPFNPASDCFNLTTFTGGPYFCESPYPTGTSFAVVVYGAVDPNGPTIAFPFYYIGGQNNTSDTTNGGSNSGAAILSAAQNLTINANAGDVLNSNSKMLAGGSVALTGNTITNRSDLLILNTTTNGTTTVANTSLSTGPAIIQAGGTVTISANNFNNIATNLVAADTFSGTQFVQGSTPASTGAGIPSTGSTGNNASASTQRTGAATSAMSSTSGGSASTNGAGTVGSSGFALRVAGTGQLAGTVLSTDTGRAAALALRSGSGAGTNGGTLSAIGAASVDSAATGAPGSISIGAIAAGPNGAAATDLVSTSLGGGGLTGGDPLAVDGIRQAGIIGGSGSLSTVPFSAQLVSAFDGAGLPSISNQGFGSFLGSFLSSLNLTGNSPSLFTYSSNPDSRYLFTTNAALSSEAALYDSSYFFDKLDTDRATTYARLGDGFFEAMLVSREVQGATGQAQLAGFGSALDQYQGLLQNAVDAQAGLDLQLGVALTAAQVAELTSPILWYVRSTVDGRDVLVPVLYLAASNQKTIQNTSLVGGTNVLIAANGGINNSGTIKASQIVALAANGGDLVNATGGVITGGTVIAQAAGDILLKGGSTITAAGAGSYALPGGATVNGSVVSLSAGRDIAASAVISTDVNVDNTFNNSRNWSKSTTIAQKVTGATISSAAGIQLTAGNNITLNAATLTSQGATALVAGGDVTLTGTAATTNTWNAARTGKYKSSNSTTQETSVTGATVTAAGPISIVALGGTVAMTGASLQTTNSAAGAIDIYGANGVSIAAAQNTSSGYEFQQTGKKSTVTTKTTALTNTLTDIDAAGSLSITTSGALAVNGGILTSGGALSVDAGSFAVNGVVDTATSDIATWKKKSGLLSSKVTRTHTVSSDETVVASVLSGDTVDVTTPGAVSINGSSVVATNGLGITAAGPVSVGTMVETDTYNQTISVKKSGLSLGGGGLFIGAAKTKTTADSTQVTNVGSLVGTENGDVSIVSGDKLSVTGSQIAAGGDPSTGSGGAVLLAGKSIEIANALDVTDTTQKVKSSSVGVSIGVQSQVIQSTANLVDAAKIATSTSNERVAAVAGLAGGVAAVNAYNAGKGLASTLDKGQGNLGITVGVNFGISKSKSTALSHDETVVASQVTGNTVALVATGEGPQGTITVTGSNLAAAQDLTLAANGPITIAAASETDSQSGNAKSSGFNVGASVSLGLDKKKGLTASGPTFSVGVSSSKSNYAGTGVTHIESTLAAGGTTSIATPGALTIDGSSVSGEKVVVDAGSLAIASRQDTSTFSARSKSTSVSASVSMAGDVSVSGNFSSGKQNGTFASVAEQAGIYAGSGGFDITVAGNTDLKGAVIASEAEAAQNRLATGTLTASDIENTERWKASQTSLGGGIGANIGSDRQGQASSTGASPLPALGPVTAAPPIALSAGGRQSGVTTSAIAPGSITIISGDAASQTLAETISRDPAGANAGSLTQDFTDAKREEVAQGFQAAQILATETSAFFARKAEQAALAKKEAETGYRLDNTGQPLLDGQGNPIPLSPGEREQAAQDANQLTADYGAGSPARLIATAVTGAAGANVAGSLTSLVQASAVNVLQGLAVHQVKQIADSLKEGDSATAQSETVRAALQAVVGCAGSAAGGSGDCGGAAMGAAGSVVVNYLLTEFGAPEAKDTNHNGVIDPDEKLTLAQQQARTDLVATVVAGIAAGAGVDVAAAVTAAQIETENNSISTSAASYGKGVCTPDGTSCLSKEQFLAKPDVIALIEATGLTEEQVYACAIGDGSKCTPQISATYAAAQQQAVAAPTPEETAEASAALANQIALSGNLARSNNLEFLSGGNAEQQDKFAQMSDAELADLAAFKREWDSLSPTAQAQVREDMANYDPNSKLGKASAALVTALFGEENVQDAYLTMVQGEAEFRDFGSGLRDGTGEMLAPLGSFLGDAAIIASVTDPNTGAPTGLLDTPEGRETYADAAARMNARFDAAAGSVEDAASALGQLASDLAPPPWVGPEGQLVYEPTKDEVDAYNARVARGGETIKSGAIAAGQAVMAPAVNLVDACLSVDPHNGGACGRAVPAAATNLALAVVSDGVASRLAAVGVKTETAIDAGIVWGKGIDGQGYPWEDYIAAQLPADARLPPAFKTFDFYDEGTGQAISAKTLDTSTPSRVANPSQIYGTLKGYVDAVVDFPDYALSGREVFSSKIASREIYLAVPPTTTAAQWEQIMKAAEYAKTANVKLNLTVTK